MKEKILNWLSFDRSFDSGVRLYHEFGNRLSLKKTFNNQGATEYNKQLLIDELTAIAGIHAEEVKNILAKPVARLKKRVVKPEPVAETIAPEVPVVENNQAPEVVIQDVATLKQNLPETIRKSIKLREEFPFLKAADCPNELKILVADMLTAYDNYKAAHEALFTAENEQELLKFSKETVENYLTNQLIWDELNHYKMHHEILGKHPIFDEMKELAEIKALNPVELVQRRNNLRSGISQLNKKIAKGDKPELNFQRQENLASKERLLKVVEDLIPAK